VFPENFSAKELFQSCKQYGHVVDSFIPRKRTKEGKRFGFVRFINVFNIDRLVNNLCTIWVGQFKLHANKARFQKATLNKGQGADHKKVANSPHPNSGDSGSTNSYVNAVKKQKSVDHDSPAIVLDEDCALPYQSQERSYERRFRGLECKLLRRIVGSLRIFLCEIERGIPR
ncbi:nucleotide-binding alpha-beta plait domain-containing protein, partial [Tanacetum coccineum]